MLGNHAATVNGQPRHSQLLDSAYQVDELVELFSCITYSPEVFRQARRQQLAGAFDPILDRAMATLYSIMVELADRHANGELPTNLPTMLRTELQLRHDDPAISLALDNGLLDRIFAVEHGDSATLTSRGGELLRRFLASQVVGDLRHGLDMLGSNCTWDEVHEALARPMERMDRMNETHRAFNMLDSEAFVAANYSNAFLVDQVLVQNQPALVGGGVKLLKTSIAIDLAVSLGIGPPAKFLNRFEVQQHVNVGIFSGESGPATLQNHYRRVLNAKCRQAKDCRTFWDFQLPQLSNKQDLQRLAATIRRHDLKLVILDPLYLSLLAGNRDASASNLFDTGPILAGAAKACLEAGATPVLVHHTARGRARPGQPAELEDLAFAGMSEFARQWIMISRRAKFDPVAGCHELWLNIGGSAGFSGQYAVDITEGGADAPFGRRRWHVHVMTECQQIEHRGQQLEAARNQRREDARQRVLETLGQHRAGATLTAIRNSSGVATSREILEGLVEDGLVERCQVLQHAGRGQRNYPGYRLSSSSAASTSGPSPNEGDSTS